MSPIAELSEARRIGRDFKVRLGVRVKRTPAGGRERVNRDDPMLGSWPTEVDWFVLEEAPEDVQQAYGEKPKSLRIMLYAEFDARTPDGEELVWSLNNRAYGFTRGLRCKGTGRSREAMGSAVTDDERWATRIEQATGEAPEKLPSLSGVTKWRVRCLGRDCPKYLYLTEQPDPEDPAKSKQQIAPGHDRDASCKAVGILRCYLLHPTSGLPLGVMELATGSINSIIDIQSDLDLKVRVLTGGRTAGIPLTLVRRPTTTYRPVKQVHYTCSIRVDAAEAQQWAARPLNEIFMTDAQRELQRRLASQPLGLTVDSVAGLLPDRLVPEEVLQTPRTGRANGETDPPAEPVDGLSADPGPPTSPLEPGPLLVKAQIDELKDLAGGPMDRGRPADSISNPYRPEALDRLKGAIRAMNGELGSDVARLSELRVEHADWLRERLRSLPPLEDPTTP